MNETPPPRKYGSGAMGFLAVIVGIIILMMTAYCFVVAARGLDKDFVFFNLVELVPLALMVVVFWITAILRPKKRAKK